jgi:hypothetical protein
MRSATFISFARLEESRAVKETIHIEPASQGVVEFPGVEDHPRLRELKVRLLANLDLTTGLSIYFPPGTEAAERPGLDLAIIAAATDVATPGTLYIGDVNLNGAIQYARSTLAVAKAVGSARLVTGPRAQYRADWHFTHHVAHHIRELSAPVQPFAPIEAPASEPAMTPLALALLDAFKAGESVLVVGRPGSGGISAIRAASGALACTAPASEIELRHDAMSNWNGRTPARFPHHTASVSTMVGSMGRPGEVALAHGGILALDQADEFPASVVAAARACQQQRKDSQGRSAYFAVAGTARSCACWPTPECTCSSQQKARQERNIDRLGFDIVIDAKTALPYQFGSAIEGPSDATV